MFRTALISTCIICSAVSADTPVVYEDFKLIASDGETTYRFGRSVSISEDKAVIGSYVDHGGPWDGSGAVYVYQFDGSAWIEQDKLLPTDSTYLSSFGDSVSIFGDVIAVGAPWYGEPLGETGAVFVFRFNGINWVQESVLLASDGENKEYPYFGSSVSISGDRIIVGSYGCDELGNSSGAAYIFQYSNGVWVEEVKLLASDGEAENRFGNSVCIDSNTVIIGAHYDNEQGYHSGSAYIFQFNGKSWVEKNKLLPSNGHEDMNFGSVVSISGDNAIIGAPRAWDYGTNSGAAYIFNVVDGTWIEAEKLLATDGSAGDSFGRTVSISNNKAIIGAYDDNSNGTDAGSAYLYEYNGLNWSELAKLMASDGAQDDNFASQFSIDGDWSIGGAPQDDDNGDFSGSAYIFYVGEPVDTDGDGVPDYIDNCYLYNPDQADCNENGIGDVCDVADQTSFDCDQNNVPDECQPDCDGDGWIDPCDNDGDCDGDGIPDNCELDCNENGIPDDCDIILGISQDCNENGIPDECDIADGLEEDCNGNGVPDSCDLEDDPSLDCDGDGVFDSCAINDGLVEDCNGNNIPDLCEIDDGTEQDCNGNDVPDSCELEVVFQEETKLLSSDGEWYDEFGWHLAISGDTVVAGASGDDDNGSDSGSAYIYKLAGGVWQETKLLASDGASNDYFGISVATSGDTVVVGAHFDDDNGNDSGSAYIYRFDGSDWIETKLLASDGATDDLFGVSVATSGDTVVVGAYRDDDNGNDSGSAYIYRFDGSDWIETKLIASDGATDDLFGVSVATSGDTVVVGAYRDDDNGFRSGSAYIYRFDGSSWIETKLLASDGATDDLFGVSVATSGDTVVVGASDDDDNGFRSGSAYIYRFDGSSWIETKLLASDGASNDHFGRRVATNGDTVVVGASGDDDNIFGSGSAYIYRFDGSSWIETKLIASDAIYYDLFGGSVAISGDKVVVGALGKYGLGSVYIFGATMLANDCNANGVPDECDIDDGTSNDVNGNGIPDECEVDCNGNGVPDHWDIKTGTSEDCNTNGVPDECDIDDGTSNDVNGNGIPDECEVDCNSNGYPDDYDIQMEWSYDVNGDIIPDECQCIADITGDNMVDVNDLLAIIGYWGSDGPLGDINQDGIVDVTDLLIVVGNWGPCE